MLHANAYVPASMDDTYTRPMSDPLDTTPCNRPSANSTNGTLASFRGRADGTTRAVLDLSQTDNAPSPMHAKGGVHTRSAERKRIYRRPLTTPPGSGSGTPLGMLDV
ncbi:hypothetical protein GCM10010294_64390 [Streptomyces griseoloalbus]|nr:hypothetical protein GCM10010294_64390 [Streptomyces griseoloalbus]